MNTATTSIYFKALYQLFAYQVLLNKNADNNLIVQHHKLKVKNKRYKAITVYEISLN